MKFDKLVKMAGTMGSIVEYKGRNYFMFDGMIARIPDGISGLVCTAGGVMPEVYARVVEDGEAELAVLTDAFLPFANDKPSELRRVFSTQLGSKVDISNKMFGLLEKHDELSIVSAEIDGAELPAALQIGWSDVEPEAWIFAGEYWPALRRYQEAQKA